MNVKNKKTSKIISIPKNAKTMLLILKSLKNEPDELGTGDIARKIGNKTRNILPACKKLQALQVIEGQKGFGNPAFKHHDHGVLTREKIEKIKIELKKQGYTDDEIEVMIEELFHESQYLGSPPEWKWRINKDCEITST